MNKVLAGITTYNPSIELLTKNIEAIIEQVDEIVIVDNRSNNVSEIEELTKKYNIQIIKNEDNKGIGTALNQILDFSFDNQYEWFLTLDQDSICKKGLIGKYSNYLDSSIGQLTCIVEDINYGLKFGRNAKKSLEYEDVNDCITSGSLNNTSLIKTIGGYNESLFIDGVDLDLSLRIRKEGYIIRRINQIGILHTEGEGKKISFLFFDLKLANHSPWRNYYARRNMIYISRKHLKGFRKKTMILKQILYGLGTILFENNKKDRIKYNCKGIVDGLKCKI